MPADWILEKYLGRIVDIGISYNKARALQMCEALMVKEAIGNRSVSGMILIMK
ncbi:hypothetical protein SAMN02745181_0612 [Rubritalea squalenifaciens DSM 18772]|uniref:Uncharacterized protein n=1 Tax=Rubritalea squalenifaciens DSM 18772 TaxID=1123071 RepID=A0A1M6D076_9BACT|nr:hypothetical protein SAMN02745181_0612 [Rubritalea squalenifaciens DSM 18772]